MSLLLTLLVTRPQHETRQGPAAHAHDPVPREKNETSLPASPSPTFLRGGHEARRKSSLLLEDRLLARDELEARRRLGDVKLGVVHVGLDVGEEGCREVALTSVGEHSEDDRTLGGLRR